MEKAVTADLSVKCLVSSRLPTEYSHPKSNSFTRILLYSTTTNTDSHEEETGGGAEHLVMVFGNEFYSQSLETVRNGDSAYSLEMRGATRWRLDGKYSKLLSDESLIWQDDQDGTDAGGTIAASANSSDSECTAIAYPLKHGLESKNRPDPSVRIHSSCFTGETLGSLRCDCAEQLHSAIAQMSAADSGLLVYLHQEGRGIGLLSKLFAYNLIDTQKYDTYSANVALGHLPDEREYKIASLILKDLGVDRCRLLTNNPDKMEQLQRDGIEISSRVPMVPQSWTSPPSLLSAEDPSGNSNSDASAVLPDRRSKDRDGYLMTKIKKMGHQLSVPSFLETLLSKDN